MSSRSRLALRGSVASVVLLIATWYAAFHVGLVRRADQSATIGFVGLDGSRLHSVAEFVAGLCDPRYYVFLAAVPISVALIRRRPRLAMVIAGILLAANETTELLKALVSSPRLLYLPDRVLTGAWPSGHATAAMSLALCAVIVAPARLRPLVGATMAAFAVAVSYSVLELGSHYPSDVLGGFLVAAMWTMLGAAALWSRAGHRSPRRAESGAAARVSVAAALAPVALLVVGALLLGAAIAVVHPHAVGYAAEHAAFIVGAVGIGALGLTISAGATLALRRA